MFSFDIREVFTESWEDSQILSVLGQSANELFDSLGITEDVEDGLDDLRGAFRALFIIYCIAIVFTGLAFFACVFWLFKAGRLGPLLSAILATFAWIFMAIASAIATVISDQGAKATNKGSRAGISADKGSGFLGMTWAAFACIFVASLFGCVGCFTEQKKRKTAKTYNEKP
jgi:hypothetical protein